MAFNKQYFYLLVYLALFELILLTTADNQTDHHSNETIVLSNSTNFSLTTIADLTNEEVNTTLPSSEAVDDSTILPTTTASEIDEATVAEENTTVSIEDDQTTAITTEVSTEKVSATTIISLNADCQLTKYGCCVDNNTVRMGTYRN